MSFLGNTELKKSLKDNIDCFDEKRIDAGKYELSLGNTYYSSDSTEFKVQQTGDSGQVVLNPGQFSLLITKETIKIPENNIGFISIKAGIKFAGLVNISGFHVDPGFNGKLKFSVYNAGSNKINLAVGEPVFQLWLASLTSETQYTGSHQGQSKISSHDLNKYMRGEVASPVVLQEEIKKVAASKERNFWYIKILIGIMIGILLKLMTDWHPYKNSIKNEIKLELKEEMKSEIREEIINDKNFILIDSLIRKRVNEKAK